MVRVQDIREGPLESNFKFVTNRDPGKIYTFWAFLTNLTNSTDTLAPTSAPALNIRAPSFGKEFLLCNRHDPICNSTKASDTMGTFSVQPDDGLPKWLATRQISGVLLGLMIGRLLTRSPASTTGIESDHRPSAPDKLPNTNARKPQTVAEDKTRVRPRETTSSPTRGVNSHASGSVFWRNPRRSERPTTSTAVSLLSWE